MLNTLYAFLAMIMMMLLSLNWQRSSLVTITNQMRSEIISMASGVASEEFEAMGVAPFDSLTVLDSTFRNVVLPLEQDTVFFDLMRSVRFVEKQAGEFVSAAGETDFQEVSLSIAGMLDTRITMSRIFNRNAE